MLFGGGEGVEGFLNVSQFFGGVGLGLVGFGDFQVVVGAAVFGDEVVPVVDGLLKFEAGVSDFLFLLFEFLLGRGFRVEEVIAGFDSLLELEAGRSARGAPGQREREGR